MPSWPGPPKGRAASGPSGEFALGNLDALDLVEREAKLVPDGNGVEGRIPHASELDDDVAPSPDRDRVHSALWLEVEVDLPPHLRLGGVSVRRETREGLRPNAGCSCELAFLLVGIALITLAVGGRVTPTWVLATSGLAGISALLTWPFLVALQWSPNQWLPGPFYVVILWGLIMGVWLLFSPAGQTRPGNDR